MGKRKERRLAAMIAASRRVKLDLFAEPSGELVDNSLHEVGGDPNQEHHTGVPVSPSSATRLFGGRLTIVADGQKQENPLLLLGQYSDDESDDESNKRPKHADDRGSSPEFDAQIEEFVATGIETGSSVAEDLTNPTDQKEPEHVETVKDPDGGDLKESDLAPEAPLPSETDVPPQICLPEASEVQADGDMIGGWKTVLHEDSNRYYYWNTVTGETSWVAPSGLALENEASDGQNISLAAEGVGSVVDVHTAAHVNSETLAYAYATSAGFTNPISQHVVDYGAVLGIGKEDTEVVQLSYDTNQCLTHYSTGVDGISYQGSSMMPDYDSLHQSQTAVSGQLTSECYEQTDALSVWLVKYCESLLERLKALDSSSSGHNLEGRGLIVKELEVRLSDCKALSSHGSALLPFWCHTETQLKQLEFTISNEEATLLVQTEGCNKTEENPQQSTVRDEPPLQNTGAGSENKSSSVENDYSSNLNDLSKEQVEDSRQSPDCEDDKTQKPLFVLTGQQFESEQGQGMPEETDPSTIPVHNHAPYVEEDMDIDVEMEVDEEATEDHTPTPDLSINECPAPFDYSIQPIPPSSPFPAIPSDEPIPPPPDEEWIPPPPPDSELVPLPPPEEPSVSCPLLPYADTMPYPSFQGPYDLGYTVQNYEYYAPTTSEGTNCNYYAHNEGTYSIEAPQPPTYVPLVASAFPEVPVVVNPIEPAAYYDVSSATIPPLPVVNSIAGTSEFYVESAPVSYQTTVAASDQTTSVGFTVESGNSLQEVKPEPDISQGPSTSSTTQAAGSSLINGSSSVDALPPAAPKGQTKVMRSKKRTVSAVPSLRSNKKVSSLVDKWKAAKEELHGEEDEEPESALEALEKKRQKNIEEWCARQIANGEARENANFLPLGGDWRERVKRKKAKAEAEAARTSLSAADEKKQPDLVVISKVLPPGWQAYWDESTKGVYYGNTITSETTWTRPTS